MNHETDEEIDDDVRARVASLRDPERKREPMRMGNSTTVAMWPCKACKRDVEVPEEAVSRFHAFSRMLMGRGEPPLEPTEIMYCDSCRDEFKRTAADRRRGQVERMRPVILQVKNSKDPEREIDAIRQLMSWGHPDVEGLVKACREKLIGSPRRAGKAQAIS